MYLAIIEGHYTVYALGESRIEAQDLALVEYHEYMTGERDRDDCIVVEIDCGEAVMV